MLIKLNNAHKDHLGKQLIINSDLVMSFYEGKDEDENDVVFVFGMQGNTWTVSNTIEEIMQQIDSVQLNK
jgi:hypothetical protein